MTSENATQNEGTKKRRMGTPGNMIRDDYLKHTRISYAEAALIAGVSVSTIHSWICEGPKTAKARPGRLRVVSRRGAFRIDRMDLERYLRME